MGRLLGRAADEPTTGRWRGDAASRDSGKDNPAKPPCDTSATTTGHHGRVRDRDVSPGGVPDRGMPALTPMLLHTADGQRLSATLLPGPGSTCVVLVPGFSGSWAKPQTRRVAAALAASASVLAYDPRGHGASTGLTTLGEREVLDVDIAVRAARDQGYECVVTCGFSMGGAAVIRQAALRGEWVAGHRLDSPPDAVAVVSSTATWSIRAAATPAMLRLHWLAETWPGRLVAARLLHTRIAYNGPLDDAGAPVRLVGRVAPLPLLVVHGDRDHYLRPDHARALAEAAGKPVELWLEPGFGHAETGASAGLLDRLAGRLATLAGATVRP